MTSRFKGRTVVVTGAASGIGAATATRLRAEGAEVIALDRNPPADASLRFVSVDMADPGRIDAAVAQLPGRIDALCNIAGLPGNHGADLTLRVNLLGLRHLTEALVPRMPRGAAVVNLASVAGNGWPERSAQHLALARTPDFAAGQAWLAEYPVDEATCYQFSKEAVIVWTMARAGSLHRDHGIRMNCVSPGPVDTPILADFRRTLGEAKVAQAEVLMGRAGTPDDIAPVVAFLCSDDARWIAGENIRVDGSLTASRATM